jgi:hypothetical protein
MNKIGYITKIKSRGKEYFYLRKSIRKSDSIEKKQIYSFGSREAALTNLKNWKENIEILPQELKELGYSLSDVLSWIEQIENK